MRGPVRLSGIHLAERAMSFTKVQHLADRRLDQPNAVKRQRVFSARAICQQSRASSGFPLKRVSGCEIKGPEPITSRSRSLNFRIPSARLSRFDRTAPPCSRNRDLAADFLPPFETTETLPVIRPHLIDGSQRRMSRGVENRPFLGHPELPPLFIISKIHMCEASQGLRPPNSANSNTLKKQSTSANPILLSHSHCSSTGASMFSILSGR